MKLYTGATIALLLMPALMAAQEQTLETAGEKASYALGYNVGRQWRAQGLPLDVELLVSALRDGLAGAEARMSDEEMSQTLQELQGRMAAEIEARNLREGSDFLRANAEREGVKTLQSGLQYEILTSGEGASPAAGDTVTVHYRGMLIDGTVFDSSYDRGEPVTIGLDRVIDGWQQALPLMKTGGKWKLFIPAGLAYGRQGGGGVIGPGATLVFEVELLSVTSPPSE
jgi:FKBP-type peptidyl-prolyl cis-trans isomerase FklB